MPTDKNPNTFTHLVHRMITTMTRISNHVIMFGDIENCNQTDDDDDDEEKDDFDAAFYFLLFFFL